MRRRPGIQGLQNQASSRAQYLDVGSTVKEVQLEASKEQMQHFRTRLEEFALHHRESIRKEPLFRRQFHRMCAAVGVDPLASNKGFWAQKLQVGDFYYELGVQVVEACLYSRDQDGGLLDVEEVLRRVKKKRGNAVEQVEIDDILQAVRALQKLGAGFDVAPVGSKMIVRSVPYLLRQDHGVALAAAQEDGHVSLHALIRATQWTEERAQQALDDLLKEGMAWIDETPHGDRWYWFPCLKAAPS